MAESLRCEVAPYYASRDYIRAKQCSFTFFFINAGLKVEMFLTIV